MIPGLVEKKHKLGRFRVWPFDAPRKVLKRKRNKVHVCTDSSFYLRLINLSKLKSMASFEYKKI